MPNGWLRRDDRRGLGEAVALDDHEPELAPERLELAVERRGADDEAQNFEPEQPMDRGGSATSASRQCCFGSGRRRLPARRRSTCSRSTSRIFGTDTSTEIAPRLDLRDDLARVVAAHEDHDARQHRRDERRHRLAEHVAERQQVQEAQRKERRAPLAVLEHLALDRDDVRQHVAVGDDDALRLGGRARGEDDLGDVVARDRHRRRAPAPSDQSSSCSFQTGASPVSPIGGTSWPISTSLRRDDAADAREKIGRRAVVDRHDDDAASRQPQNATIHSGRFSDKKTTLSPLREAERVQPRREAARGAADLVRS